MYFSSRSTDFSFEDVCWTKDVVYMHSKLSWAIGSRFSWNWISVDYLITCSSIRGTAGSFNSIRFKCLTTCSAKNWISSANSVSYDSILRTAFIIISTILTSCSITCMDVFVLNSFIGYFSINSTVSAFFDLNFIYCFQFTVFGPQRIPEPPTYSWITFRTDRIYVQSIHSVLFIQRIYF